MYLYDEIDQRFVDERVRQFRDQTRRFLGGRQGNDAAIGRIIGPSFARHEVPDVVEKRVGRYVELRDDPGERFVDVVLRVGLDPFREAVYALADRPRRERRRALARTGCRSTARARAGAGHAGGLARPPR